MQIRMLITEMAIIYSTEKGLVANIFLSLP